MQPQYAYFSRWSKNSEKIIGFITLEKGHLIGFPDWDGC